MPILRCGDGPAPCRSRCMRVPLQYSVRCISLQRQQQSVPKQRGVVLNAFSMQIALPVPLLHAHSSCH
jgi:hypothetical protein